VAEREKELFTKMWLAEERLGAVRSIMEKRELVFDQSTKKQAGF